MGNSYYATRGLWWNGQNSQGSTVMQDDMAVIAGPANGFGYRVSGWRYPGRVPEPGQVEDVAIWAYRK